MPHDPPGPEGHQALNLPYAAIPYWDPGEHGLGDMGDRGDMRPLPSNIAPWLCAGITTAAPYQPGQPLTATVAVRNWGGGIVDSHVMVSLWWDFPATGFARMDPGRLVGVDAVKLPPRGETRLTAPLTCTFSALPPPHICLVACVDHGRDPALRTTAAPFALIPLPGAERHWAQHNLSYIPAASTGIVDLSFIVANPGPRSLDYIIDARPVAPGRSSSLGALLHSAHITPVAIPARFDIVTAADLRAPHTRRTLRHPLAITLEAGARSEAHVRIRLAELPRPGEGAAFDVLQRLPGEDLPSGGLTVVALAPEPGRR